MTHASLVRTSFTAAALCAGLLTAALPASADTFHIQYFEGTTGSADFYNGNNVPIGVSNDYVLSTLGPDGLPVFNPNFTASGSVLAPNSAYLNSSKELLYWTLGAGPSGATIKTDGSGTIALSSTSVNMFAPGTGGTDAVYEETAILTGQFSVGGPSNVTFNVGADDMAFVYVDGQLVQSLGGIHADTSAPGNTLYYSAAGTHNVEIFYADRDVTQATLSFSETGTPVSVTATPEPSSFVLLGSGLVGAAGAVRRRFQRSQR